MSASHSAIAFRTPFAVGSLQCFKSFRTLILAASMRPRSFAGSDCRRFVSAAESGTTEMRPPAFGEPFPVPPAAAAWRSRASRTDLLIAFLLF